MEGDDYKDDRNKEVIENSCISVNTRKESNVLMALSILRSFYLIIVDSQSDPKKTSKTPKMKNYR
jgi:hypothetical protein